MTHYGDYRDRARREHRVHPDSARGNWKLHETMEREERRRVPWLMGGKLWWMVSLAWLMFGIIKLLAKYLPEGTRTRRRGRTY